VSEQMYIAQTLIVGTVLFMLFRQHPRLVQFQIVTWMIGVSLIAWRFNLVEQLNFYSNDQRYYHNIVEELTTKRFLTSEYSIESLKLPFTGPAAVLSLLGLHPTLALKAVSLIYLLVLTNILFAKFQPVKLRDQLKVSYLTGTAAIGIFFSSLALRETSMMFFAFQFMTAKRLTHSVLFLSLAYLLRPHLAAALLAGQIAASLWTYFRTCRSLGHLGLLLFIPSLTLFGSLIFIYQRSGTFIGETSDSDFFELNRSVGIASNFVGLQFLTVPESTVNFSLFHLLLFRIPLSETLVIPTVFTVVSLVFAHRIRTGHLATLGAFLVYCSISTRTDFNSFRQNIPFVPLFGVAILQLVRDYRTCLYDSCDSTFTPALRQSNCPESEIPSTVVP